ncbi:PTS system fructose subfamily IIA component [Coriobacterium glomerans PW2]|uniref:PTS system fructose subfamily IIA component n=1 Tax=Coriobacterium glomerans (strain ATCC 49209 / DSM 20642 / JCM 10262 / PW2) TaxID=700015 RepID=F2NB61_CORGP|nr:PTS sugar transporter subunit IIA [Coriobacterium glomerans]AEB07812.1 PTS system fructose subfamily IIA component [Coriobacterium glomerans PW2]
MIDFLIAGHGSFASGILSSVEMIFGSQDQIETVEFFDDETKSELDNKIDLALSRHANAKGILLFCDVLQGSPFQSAAMKALVDPRIRVVYGTNVAMVLECVSQSRIGDPSVEKLAALAVETGVAHVGIFLPESGTKEQAWQEQ